ncbi:hypothetical protein BpHYR1_044749, partial [Brachionus plicatilis]
MDFTDSNFNTIDKISNDAIKILNQNKMKIFFYVTRDHVNEMFTCYFMKKNMNQKIICTCLLDGLHDSEMLTCANSD